MLSKMTFSLAFVVMLIFAISFLTTLATAQTVGTPRCYRMDHAV